MNVSNAQSVMQNVQSDGHFYQLVLQNSQSVLHGFQSVDRTLFSVSTAKLSVGDTRSPLPGVCILRIRVVSQPFCVDQMNPAGFIVPNVLIRKTPALFLHGKLESRNKYGGRGFVADDIYFRGGVKGGTGSADPHNFSAKSTDPNFF